MSNDPSVRSDSIGPDRATEPPFISGEQITAFVDVNGRIHVYRGAGIIGTNRLEGAERAGALDAIRRAVDADYETEVRRRRDA